MLNIFKPKSDFSRNVLTLMTGNTVAQAVPIAISPILTRIYTPEEFGTFALFIATVSILGSAINGRYELAIMLPEKDDDAINIFALGFIINILLSIFLLLIVLLFNSSIVELLNNEAIGIWLYLMPFSIFLMGLFNLLNYFNNRLKNYDDLAKAKVYKSIAMAIVQLSLGFIKAGVVGLISGHLFSQIVSNTKLFFNILKLGSFKTIKYSKIIRLAKKYKEFPIINLPHSILGAFSQNIPIFMLSRYFNHSDVGFFALANRVIVTPINIIGSSYAQVFFQTFIEHNSKLSLFKEKFKSINIKFLPLFLIVAFWLPELFETIFGKEWRVAGEYSVILLPLLYMKFITNIFTSVIFIYYKKQGENLLFEVIFLFLVLFSLYFGKILSNIEFALGLMSFTGVILMIVKIYRAYLVVKINERL